MRRSSVLVLGVLVFFAPIIGAEEYRVTKVEGQAAILPKGSTKPAPAKEQITLLDGDRLITGKKGKVEFATKDGTVLEIGPSSSLQVDNIRGKVSSFFLRLGNIVGRFKKAIDKKKKERFRLRTPLAVASVRGTDLSLAIGPDGRVEAGVIEGEVVFGPEEAEITVKESEGLVVEPGEEPKKTNGFPPLVVSNLDWFEHVHERVKSLREEWKELDTPSQMKLRTAAFHESITWEIPPKIKDSIAAPSKTPFLKPKKHKKKPFK